MLRVAWLCSGEEEVEDLFEDFDFSARFFDCNEGDFQDKYVHSCCVHMHMSIGNLVLMVIMCWCRGSQKGSSVRGLKT